MHSDLKHWQETVTLPVRITHNQFGCNAEFFEAHVRGQKLLVAHCTGIFTYVEIQGELYGIHQDDLISDSEYQLIKSRQFEEWKNKNSKLKQL